MAHLADSSENNDFFIKQAIRNALMAKIEKSGKIDRIKKKLKSIIDKAVKAE